MLLETLVEGEVSEGALMMEAGSAFRVSVTYQEMMLIRGRTDESLVESVDIYDRPISVSF